MCQQPKRHMEHYVLNTGNITLPISVPCIHRPTIISQLKHSILYMHITLHICIKFERNWITGMQDICIYS